MLVTEMLVQEQKLNQDHDVRARPPGMCKPGAWGAWTGDTSGAPQLELLRAFWALLRRAL